MARHHKKSSSLSLSQSEPKSSDDGSLSSEESFGSSSDEPSLGSHKGLAKPKRLEKRYINAYILRKANDRKGPGSIRSGREECMHVACWIPHGINMFIILKDTFCIARTKDAQECQMKTYQRIISSAPYLRTLVRGHHNRKKLEAELNSILSEMQEIIGQIRSKDTSHLKPFIGNYVVAQPGIKGLEPLIFLENKKSCARMGVNHPHLAGMLCPVKHVKAYHADPKKVQEKLQNGEIKMVAGIDFDIEDIQEGLLRGHLLKHVL
ncbi:uncharacterized protein EDB93DRAFT_1105484 [Suillus bovinus]|uniref:uncharacterized protein n=1 Tax=Suillus bovinus TaxID=48563 RepID=UPI001B86F908|nr:uncharacterized protein EDB93DRAFT_1105484 [Suillus bovinus]KAG2142229.1 hypothetical protein EDB93DRAFT_1105484 [Suillus bovinus]